MDSEQAPARFTGEEARAKLGSRVRSIVAIDGIASGTSGRVMQVDEIGSNRFDLIVEWDTRLEGKRQHDWFTKNNSNDAWSLKPAESRYTPDLLNVIGILE